MVRNQGRVTRFVVMAVLQAARAEALGLPRAASYSWGLNRAIFIAAAKRGFRGGGAGSSDSAAAAATAPQRVVYRLGDDEAYRDPAEKELVFRIGDQSQTVADFEREVVARFGTKENFQAAWSEAVRIVGGFDRRVLESRERFYGEVYRPRRDELSDTWTQKYSPPPAPKKAR
jgi:murein DD-endopeptidase MepM/ murein hydrolase activator NlpD